MSHLSVSLYISALYKAENQEVNNKTYLYIHIHVCVLL